MKLILFRAGLVQRIHLGGKLSDFCFLFSRNGIDLGRFFLQLRNLRFLGFDFLFQRCLFRCGGFLGLGQLLFFSGQAGQLLVHALLFALRRFPHGVQRSQLILCICHGGFCLRQQRGLFLDRFFQLGCFGFQRGLFLDRFFQLGCFGFQRRLFLLQLGCLSLSFFLGSGQIGGQLIAGGL